MALILPRLPNPDQLSNSLDALQTAQLTNGSWDNDVYTTALALRAFQITHNPDLAQITGTIIDGQTGSPLTNITIQLGTDTQITNSLGEFNFLSLVAGNYTLQISTNLTSEIQLKPGQNLSLGQIRLFTETTNIQGTITDASTQAPLPGVAIQITGHNDTIHTDEQGAYIITQLSPGDVILQATFDGYLTASTTLTLSAGTTHIVSLTLSPDQAILEGIVSDSNGVLAGANIYIDGTQLTQTDTNGSYRIEGLASGTHNISVELDGYDSLTGTVTTPSNTTITLTSQLYPTGTTPPDNASVTGKIIDKATQLPLASVTITNGTQTTTTDTTGQFNLTNLAAGENILSLSLTGYLDKTITVNLFPFSQLALGEILLKPEGYKTPIGIKGIVMDASTNQTLANVNIEAQFDQTPQQLTTAPDGSFEITTEVDELSAQLTFTTEGYTPYTLDIQLIADEILDIGQIRLRPEEVTVLLADLVIEQLDKTATQTEPQSLIVSGTITAQIKNIGTENTLSNTNLLAFYDIDLNSKYEETTDLTLGQATLENPLAVEETATVDITLAGELPFRDAPIHVWLDNTQTVVESDEENNIGTTTSLCEIVPDIGTFEPVLKWEWAGASVTMTPMVAPLIDTNGDLQINQLDEPAIVFIGDGFPDRSPGILIAVSGVDGRELWRLNSHQVHAPSQIAIADIDGDKIPEIIANLYRGGTMAVNNDGTVKWTSPYPNYSVGLNYGGYSVADLDGDGQAEIVIDKTVLNTDGSLRWKGSSRYFGYQLSVIADINLDGKPEIIVGPSAYDADGNLLWENLSLNDGTVAIANFNEDPFPEIILVGERSVHMLNHQGEIIWGPVIVAPRAGGAPTIADADGDGILDIGVAAASKYYVINSDGSIKWSYPVVDGSEQTGSTFFDFDGNGEVEVVYFDQNKLRVFKGKTGEVVFEIDNRSVTAKEYSVIADVDNDNHADLVVPSYNSSHGIRVFQDINNSWVRTRNLWNQYAYHITNINDDLSVPRVEQNSWEVHNTYRLNTIPGESVTGTPDITIGKLRLIDNGIAQPLTLSVRIGNAGAQTNQASIPLSFYSNATQLGTLTLPPIAPGTYQDIQLEGITLAELNQEISAIVEAIEECDENNNSVSTTLSTTTLHGEITLTTDAQEYGPNTPVLIQYSITNTGALSADFQLELQIEQANGDTVQSLDTPTLNTLASGETITLDTTWNTAQTLTGAYQAHLLLRAGDLIAETTQSFDIIAETLLNLRTTLDKTTYHTTDQIQIDNLIRNLSVNTLLSGAQLQITIHDESQQSVFTQQLALDDLAPQGQQQKTNYYTFQNASEGTYTVQSQLLDNQRKPLVSDTATYQIQENLKFSLNGSVVAQTPTLYQGEPQHCTDTITNNGNTQLTAQPIRQLLIALADGQEINTTEVTLDIDAGTNQSLERTITTATLQGGDYACVLSTEIEGQWENLGYAVFQVQEQAIQIESSLTLSEGGRLLILLDEGDEDPHGPQTAPRLTEQRAFLESLLEGWTYTIVTDDDAFTSELRSGGYTVYALFAEQEKLETQVQKELREAIYRGEGIVVAGAHDDRHQHLNDALGIKFKGKLPNVQNLSLHDSPLHEALDASLAFEEKPIRVEILNENTLLVGSFGEEVAATYYEYGHGQSVYISFDLLAQATATSPDSLFATLLTAALGAVHSETFEPIIGSVIPINLTLTNQGIATPGQALFDLPEGSIILGPDNVELPLVWLFELDLEQSAQFEFWLRLPWEASIVPIDVLIQTGIDPNFEDYEMLALEIEVQAPPGLLAAIDWILDNEEPSYTKALNSLEKAVEWLSAEKEDKALQELLKASDELLKSDADDAPMIRVMIGHAIRNVSAVIFLMQ
ncbi:hypothetical protein PN36_12095 [Candidatus Thiomargarita nelsonii]|uniref:CARDB domain-containing protein n=1 Tax=Candidatus Thiomargarita nelsonii TaxID=1003181 RepID=A0A4E0QQF6_9GAMM|nr:hypothetical protein PN36_12095 [Candidatus Thiomargarita nelsonii]